MVPPGQYWRLCVLLALIVGIVLLAQAIGVGFGAAVALAILVVLPASFAVTFRRERRARRPDRRR